MSRTEIRETLGLLAVVASLVFVGLEIRAANALARAATPERRAAGRELMTDLAAHGDRLVTIGDRLGVNGATLARAREARDSSSLDASSES